MPSLETLLFVGNMLLGGVLGRMTRISGGAMLGAMASATLWNLGGAPVVSLPAWYGISVQVLAGSLVGVVMTRSVVKQIGTLAFPVVSTALMVLSAAILGCVILTLCFDWHFTTAWLAGSPGRTQDMLIYASAVNAEIEKVAAVHISRLLAVLLLTPLIIRAGHALLNPKTSS